VKVATTTRTPSAAYFAIVAPPLEDSSSGWAWTASIVNGESVTGKPCLKAGLVSSQAKTTVENVRRI
jgi:hypothetical protein